MKEKILIIDREPDIQKALVFLMKQKGYSPRSVSPYEKVMDIISSEPFDLVIMDINIPGTNGIQVMRNIKEFDEHIKIIILTGQTSIENIKQTLRHEGAFDFLGKPLENEEQLINSVKQALEKRSLNRRNKKFVRKLNTNQPAGKKVLIVDDDPHIQELLTQMLSVQEFETEVASDGFEAGIKVMEFKPSLIILDLFMPGMDGFEVCKRVKGNLGTSQIKILAITGYDSKENREQIMEAGADGYMAKPVAMDTPLRHLEKLL